MKRLLLAIAVVLSASCTDVGSFTTQPGECYRGQVVTASFVRTGFEEGTLLSLTFDTSALADGLGEAGVMWTSDGRFAASSLRQMEQLAHDSLSQFQFPGGRIRNYLFNVIPADGVPAIVVVSLMENGLVEARILRPAMQICPPGDDGCASPVSYDALFGVFRLDLDESCYAPPAQ
jgi:hypothetical protein